MIVYRISQHSYPTNGSVDNRLNRLSPNKEIVISASSVELESHGHCVRIFDKINKHIKYLIVGERRCDVCSACPSEPKLEEVIHTNPGQADLNIISHDFFISSKASKYCHENGVTLSKAIRFPPLVDNYSTSLNDNITED